MSVKNIIGRAMLTAFFLGLFAASVVLVGATKAFMTVGIVIAIALWIAAGVWLATEDR